MVGSNWPLFIRQAVEIVCLPLKLNANASSHKLGTWGYTNISAFWVETRAGGPSQRVIQNILEWLLHFLSVVGEKFQMSRVLVYATTFKSWFHVVWKLAWLMALIRNPITDTKSVLFVRVIDALLCLGGGNLNHHKFLRAILTARGSRWSVCQVIKGEIGRWLTSSRLWRSILEWVRSLINQRCGRGCSFALWQELFLTRVSEKKVPASSA